MSLVRGSYGTHTRQDIRHKLLGPVCGSRELGAKCGLQVGFLELEEKGVHTGVLEPGAACGV
jgi:hypothetical protein